MKELLYNYRSSPSIEKILFPACFDINKESDILVSVNDVYNGTVVPENSKKTNIVNYDLNSEPMNFFDEQLDSFLEEHVIQDSVPEGDVLDSYCSVLGVDLSLSCSVGEINTNNDLKNINNYNITDNMDSWMDNMVYKELLIDNSFHNFSSEDSQGTSESLLTSHTLDMLHIFPHISEEKNLRRRSLLYEQSRNVNKFKHDHWISRCKKNLHALTNHDYTYKKSGDDKYFACSITNCDKVYSKSSHLKAHLKRHSGEKPFICNWKNCTWKFSRSDELARHRRSHLGIKPYKCKLCERAFARSDHLSKHNKVHKKKLAQYGTCQIKRHIRLS